MLIYGFVFRHKLSQAALGDFLTVVKILMQMSSKLPSSKYLLEKSLNIRDPKEVKRNYYCPNCQRDVLLHTIQCPNPQCSNKIDKKLLKKRDIFTCILTWKRPSVILLKCQQYQKIFLRDLKSEAQH